MKEDEQKEDDDGEGKRSMTNHLEYGKQKVSGDTKNVTSETEESI